MAVSLGKRSTLAASEISFAAVNCAHPGGARIVKEPRKVLSEMGLDFAEDVQITVHDSSSEVRWLVLPERPAGTEGLSAEQLVPLITREAMVGVARIQAP